MEKLVESAKGIEKELIEMRRALHARAEIGFDLPQTTAYITEKIARIRLCAQANRQGEYFGGSGEGESYFFASRGYGRLAYARKIGRCIRVQGWEYARLRTRFTRGYATRLRKIAQRTGR